MKKGATVLGIVLAVSVLWTSQGWTHGRGGFRGGHGGHFGGSHFSRGFGHSGSFRGGFRSPGAHGRFGRPHSHHHNRLGHRRHFRHERFFGPHHHFGSFVPPGHRRHFGHEHFFGPHHHFGRQWSGVPFLGFHGGFGSGSFGVWGEDFSSRTWTGPAGPPPLGAPGPTPFPTVHPPTVVIHSPFFCFPHGLEFTEEALFIEHLSQFHGLLPRSALSFCRVVGGGARLIFFGF
jgi:hypothetical protein